ncbi:MAG TPA: SgcJ/EcaC family oxidoreductase [Actinomycetota bacterium]|nr:SgcJ/EcaC family oxidoreductase [Actinomycetota bacterium]
MTAKTPEDIDPTWMEAFNAGDADGVLALYEPGAAFVLPTGDIAEGLDAIRQTLDGFLAMKPRIDLRTNRVLRAGDTAVLYSAWSLAATGPDGNPVEMAGSATVVVREQPDGTWQFVIDDPGWGKG